MAFDQSTRGRLQQLVNRCRAILSAEFTTQLQQIYGLDPGNGEVTALERLTQLDNQQRHTAIVLRQTLEHYLAGEKDTAANRKACLDRIVREQAFTVLNRLSALLMLEARGQLIESVSKGYESKGYQLYRTLAGTSLGDTTETYHYYLYSLFDELAVELPALFDRYAPNGLLFPRESILQELLAELNHYEVELLWAEDETLGWIYQYFNSGEERSAMRKASNAPRNSRELAVRNQFFTPRYVVEFLVDNTLGRFWFNATGGNTSLRHSCEYLLVKPDEIPDQSKQLRDPRAIKLLDPACGSMHFGLYSFDLFETIYREAWTWEQEHGPGSLDVSTEEDTSLAPLCHTYANEQDFLKDVPRLIVEYNIYGVDIDARAAQIASLALWLRAQRAWHDANIHAAERPAVGRGNVVAAVAPPANKTLRDAFVQQLDSKDAELFEKTLNLLAGVPEMGVLLRLEEELPKLIKDVFQDHGDLFREEDEERWKSAERRLREALVNFAEAANSNYQSRLFAYDALEGLRLIDLTNGVFDVVVMNPPFGALALKTKTQLSRAYPLSKSDLLAIFVERSLELLREQGLLGAITSRASFFLSSMEKWRDKIIYDESNPQVFADLGMGVMDDAMVEAAAYVLSRNTVETNDTLRCLRVLASDNKKEDLLEIIEGNNSQSYFEIELEALKKSPKKSFAYWIPKSVLAHFSDLPCIDPQLVSIRVGLQTGHDNRFLRQWWEVMPEKVHTSRSIVSQTSNKSWATYTKTDKSSPWFSPLLQVVKWENDGEEYLHFLNDQGKSRARLQNTDVYFQPGFSYMLRSARLVPYIVPRGAIPTAGRSQAFGDGNELLEALIITSSNLGSAWARLTGEKFEWPKFQAGMVQSIPHTELSQAILIKCEQLILRQFSERKRLFEAQEPYREFIKPAFFYENSFVANWNRMSLLNEELEKSLAGEYGLTEDEFAAFEQDLQEALTLQFGETQESDSDIFENGFTTKEEYEGLVSYIFGLCFGRWDIRLVLENKNPDVLVDLFAESPLPPSATGNVNEAEYPIQYIKNGVSVLDPTIAGLAGLIRECTDLLSNIKDIDEQTLCISLGVKSLSDYISRPHGFFADHLNCYSAGGRKAPIYWPLSTSSGSFTLWVYYPDLTNQTLFTAVNEFIDGPTGKLTQVNRELAELRAKGTERSREEEKDFAELEELQAELMEFRDTLLSIAPTYNPNHDDGVQITAAPLWSLFRHRTWQNTLKKTWEQLEQGDFDWAHMAMNYWPERVREKCKTDKSLAIAHGLEELYQES